MTMGSIVTKPDVTSVLASYLITSPDTLGVPANCDSTSTAREGVSPPGLCPPPQPLPARATRLRFPPIQRHPPANPQPCPIVEYRVPLEKGRPLTDEGDGYFIPPGSSADPSILIWPASPTTPFEFPFHMAEEMYCDFKVSDGLPQPLLQDSLIRVVGFMRVCGLELNSDLSVMVSRMKGVVNAIDNSLLIDGSANICITGILDLLVEVEAIAPLPILVATTSGQISLDDCRTKRGLLSLMLDNGAIYYQPCYYCKNAVETIISPQAILTASDILVCWTQTGHKDGSPGTICFDSDSGLLSFSITMENKDRLYYCPIVAFTVARDPVRCNVPLIHCAIVPPPPVKRCHKSYNPVSWNRITELEL